MKRAAAKVGGSNSREDPTCPIPPQTPESTDHVILIHPGTVVVLIVEADLTPRPLMITIQGPDGNIEPVRAANPSATTGSQQDQDNTGRPTPQAAPPPRPHPMPFTEEWFLGNGSCNRHQISNQ